MDINIRVLLREPRINTGSDDIHAILEDNKPEEVLHKACNQLCMKFLHLFQPELRCLKDYKLEVAFQLNAKPVFCKPRTVSFTILEDLNAAYDAGIK